METAVRPKPVGCSHIQGICGGVGNYGQLKRLCVVSQECEPRSLMKGDKLDQGLIAVARA